MKTFTIERPNLFYYVTSVTFNRVPVFKNERACKLLIDVFTEVRAFFPYKLIAYVIMPDHFHAIVNLIDGNISKWLLRIRGNAGRKILDAVRGREIRMPLERFRLPSPQKRNHRYAVWQKDPSIVDLVSDKFLLQKSGYIHSNPVRAKLVAHPAKWPWSSYLAYLPHEVGEVPIEIDRRAYWTDAEIDEYLRRSSGGSPTLNGGEN